VIGWCIFAAARMATDSRRYGTDFRAVGAC
jgi:hypothetical protein